MGFMRGPRKSESNAKDLDATVTPEDLAPTSEAKETGGETTQGDFLMAAKARRRQLAEQGRQSDPTERNSGSGTLDDTSIHTSGPPSRRIQRGGSPTPSGGLGDIDMPKSMPTTPPGGGLSDVDIPRPTGRK
jgi:hypothetical protein